MLSVHYRIKSKYLIAGGSVTARRLVININNVKITDQL